MYSSIDYAVSIVLVLALYVVTFDSRGDARVHDGADA